MRKLPSCPVPARIWSDDEQAEFRNYHDREAARLWSLLATATTPALRARLLEEAEEHERLAEEVEDLKAAAAEAEA